MRGICGAILLVALGSAAAQAGWVLDEASGNWAGASGQGHDFRAVLEDDQGQAHLRIYLNNEVDPQLDMPAVTTRNPAIAAGKQYLHVVESDESTVLSITSISEENGIAAREIIKIGFLDNQFTVIGYSYEAQVLATAKSYGCQVDLRENFAVVDGARVELPARMFEDDNLTSWGPGHAFAMAYCPAVSLN